ncbi:putative lipid-transfer protein DIR1 [Prosopis cineraria]|uniref:putative lipid-transfer protein DIR1 n=1 Tax=Prosopis cineraria TaxID=364024 RepID=UPI00240FEABA|nr:putative lipid-transfer protein DIR1 [Prosopis cineraria]
MELYSRAIILHHHRKVKKLNKTRMRVNTAALVVVIVVAVMFVGGSRGLSLCNLNEEGIAACKPSVSEPNPVDPSTECCKALSGADLECLCSYKNSFQLPLLGIDPNLALALPAKCNLTLPSDC